MRRLRVGSAIAALVLAGAALVAGAAPAQAHNSVIGTVPEDGSVVTTQPGTFALTTSDMLLTSGTENGANAMTIQGPDGTYYGDGCAVVAGPALTMDAQLGDPGEYTVTWQVVSADGHPVSNTYAFTWQPDATQKLAKGSATRPMCGAEASPAATPAPAEHGESESHASDIAWLIGAIALVLALIVAVLVILLRSRSAARAPRDLDEHRAGPGPRES